jgi:hypothetical protein
MPMRKSRFTEEQIGSAGAEAGGDRTPVTAVCRAICLTRLAVGPELLTPAPQFGQRGHSRFLQARLSAPQGAIVA